MFVNLNIICKKTHENIRLKNNLIYLLDKQWKRKKECYKNSSSKIKAVKVDAIQYFFSISGYTIHSLKRS